MFTPFECADCGGSYVPTEGGCKCIGCGDFLAWANVLLEPGQLETVRNGVCGSVDGAEPKPITVPTVEQFGKNWCPECDSELVESGGNWHHFLGERNGCTWTD